MTEVDKNADVDHNKNCSNSNTDPENRSLHIGVRIWCSRAVEVIGADYHQQKIYQYNRKKVDLEYIEGGVVELTTPEVRQQFYNGDWQENYVSIGVFDCGLREVAHEGHEGEQEQGHNVSEDEGGFERVYFEAELHTFGLW